MCLQLWSEGKWWGYNSPEGAKSSVRMSYVLQGRRDVTARIKGLINSASQAPCTYRHTVANSFMKSEQKMRTQTTSTSLSNFKWMWIYYWISIFLKKNQNKSKPHSHHHSSIFIPDAFTRPKWMDNQISFLNFRPSWRHFLHSSCDPSQEAALWQSPKQVGAAHRGHLVEGIVHPPACPWHLQPFPKQSLLLLLYHGTTLNVAHNNMSTVCFAPGTKSTQSSNGFGWMEF